MKKKKMKKVDMFGNNVSIFRKLWFYLTALRPITKYEYIKLINQLVTILDGMRESDMMHYQTERQIIEELKKIIEDEPRNKNNKDRNEQMYS